MVPRGAPILDKRNMVFVLAIVTHERSNKVHIMRDIQEYFDTNFVNKQEGRTVTDANSYVSVSCFERLGRNHPKRKHEFFEVYSRGKMPFCYELLT